MKISAQAADFNQALDSCSNRLTSFKQQAQAGGGLLGDLGGLGNRILGGLDSSLLGGLGGKLAGGLGAVGIAELGSQMITGKSLTEHATAAVKGLGDALTGCNAHTHELAASSLAAAQNFGKLNEVGTAFATTADKAVGALNDRLKGAGLDSFQQQAHALEQNLLQELYKSQDELNKKFTGPKTAFEAQQGAEAIYRHGFMTMDDSRVAGMQIYNKAIAEINSHQAELNRLQEIHNSRLQEGLALIEKAKGEAQIAEMQNKLLQSRDALLASLGGPLEAFDAKMAEANSLMVKGCCDPQRDFA